MTLATDYAARIRRAADTLDRLSVDRRDPDRYHETKDETVQDLRKLADAVEIDQVFANRAGLPPEVPAFRRGPRHVVDHKGRTVKVETRRRMAKAV